MPPPRSSNPPVSGIALMLLAMFCVASNDAIGKFLSQDYSVWQILWVRSWIWLSFALIWVSFRGGVRRALRSSKPLLQAVRSLLLVIEVTLFIVALRYLPLGDVIAVASATPLVVLACAVLFLGERVGRHRWTAVAAGMAGMLIVARPGGEVFGWLTLLPILGVLLWGIYQVMLRLVSRSDSAETTLLWTGIALFTVTGTIAPWYWQNPPDLQTWTWFIAVGVFNTTAHFALIVAMERSEASALQPFSYTVVAWAMFIGWLFFGETPDTWTLSGTALIIAGGLYALYRERKLAAGAA